MDTQINIDARYAIDDEGYEFRGIGLYEAQQNVVDFEFNPLPFGGLEFVPVSEIAWDYMAELDEDTREFIIWQGEVIRCEMRDYQEWIQEAMYEAGLMLPLASSESR